MTPGDQAGDRSDDGKAGRRPRLRRFKLMYIAAKPLPLPSDGHVHFHREPDGQAAACNDASCGLPRLDLDL